MRDRYSRPTDPIPATQRSVDWIQQDVTGLVCGIDRMDALLRFRLVMDLVLIICLAGLFCVNYC